jgi:uncharacterized membrane protein YkoI
MRSTLIMAASVLLAGAPLFTGGCAKQHEPKEDEVEVTLDQVPPAVKETLARESGGAPMGTIERENEKGRTVYETRVDRAGKTWELEVDENGKVLERKEAKKGDKKD